MNLFLSVKDLSKTQYHETFPTSLLQVGTMLYQLLQKPPSPPSILWRIPWDDSATPFLHTHVGSHSFSAETALFSATSSAFSDGVHGGIVLPEPCISLKPKGSLSHKDNNNKQPHTPLLSPHKAPRTWHFSSSCYSGCNDCHRQPWKEKKTWNGFAVAVAAGWSGSLRLSGETLNNLTLILLVLFPLVLATMDETEQSSDSFDERCL